MALVLGLVATTSSGAALADAENACSQGYAQYSLLGAAWAVRTFQHAPGVTIVESGDASALSAQSQVDSILGSSGYAGGAYSPTVAENMGQGTQRLAGVPVLGDLSAESVPVWVTSSYPTNPKPEPKTAPGGSLSTTSLADSSKASATAGGPSEDQGSVGRSSATSSASCARDGALHAIADDVTENLVVAGVLRIASVRSHAEITVLPDGTSTLEGSMEVEGASVLNQPAAVTEKGIVVGSAVAPSGTNPFQQALDDAGIRVRYIAGEEDEKSGQVLAPGLQITVTERVGDVGTGPTTTSYELGRAFARAGGLAVPPVTVPGIPRPATGLPVTTPPTTLTPPDAEVRESAIEAPASAEGRMTPGPAASIGPSVAPQRTAQMGEWSLTPAYAALALGALVLLGSRFVTNKLIARFQWT